MAIASTSVTGYSATSTLPSPAALSTEVVAGGGVGQAIEASGDRVVVIRLAPSSTLLSQELDSPLIFRRACSGNPRAHQGVG
jgi:hypothetical protein